jgi:hypothetical protein
VPPVVASLAAMAVIPHAEALPMALVGLAWQGRKAGSRSGKGMRGTLPPRRTRLRRVATEEDRVPRDPLAMLAKLRQTELEAARRRLAAAADALLRQRRAAAEADAALRAETPEGAPPTYGAFLARSLACRQAETAALARAEAALDAERDAVATARRAEKVLALLRQRRAAVARRIAVRRDEARLEDALPKA